MKHRQPIALPYPGRRTRNIAKMALACALITVTILGSIGTWLPGLVTAFASLFPASAQANQPACPQLSNSTASQTSCPVPSPDGNTPNQVGAYPLPNLSLPKTVLSTVDTIDTAGVVQTSPQNLTLYNSRVVLRLLGGSKPRDQLIGAGNTILSHNSFWDALVNLNGSWRALVPISSNFTFVESNSTGAYVIRSMRVSNGPYAASLTVIYTATSTGPLKWDLQFTPDASGNYRLAYTWWNLTNTYTMSSASRQFQVKYSTGNYTLSWTDVPTKFNPAGSVFGGGFSLSIDLGNVLSGTGVQVDPYVLGSTTLPSPTAYTFQRKSFFEPKAGRYWAFYGQGCYSSNTLCGFYYRSSADGVSWSSSSVVTGSQGCCRSQPDPSIMAWNLYYAGQTVVIAYGEQRSDGDASNVYYWMYYLTGAIVGSQINWTLGSNLSGSTSGCSGFLGQCNYGARYVYVTPLPAGGLAFSYNLFINATASSNCSGNTYSESDQLVLFIDKYGNIIGGPYTIASATGCNASIDITNQDRSILLNEDSSGRVRIIYQYCGSSCNGSPSMHSQWIDSSGNKGTDETVQIPVKGSEEFSAVKDANYGTHLVYRTTDGKVSYAYHLPPASASWALTPDIFSATASYPTVTADYSTNDVYALGFVSGGSTSSIIMRSKTLTGIWSDQSPVYPVTGRTGPSSLTSNAVSISSSNSSQIVLEWTEGTGPYNALFASVPIQTVWSPYSSPTDPWNGNGLAPYGQYFSNLGEYVSPSTGMLTIRQTDLQVPGRRLSLEITRVFSEPSTFLSNVPYNYEQYPWAPMGKGWQLNFPWLNNTNKPLYIHLWDGQGYRIPSNFWTSFSTTFENHQGENFRLVRYVNGTIILFDKTANSYVFGTSPSHALIRITDSTGNNTITFSHTNNLISCINDTVSHAFTFSYSSGLLQTIAQVSGTCASPGVNVRTLSYANDGQSLTSETDPAGRKTSYSYNATSSSSIKPWLLGMIRYPTNWITNYTYSVFQQGTTGSTYRVKLQITGSSASSPTRQFGYAYNQPVGDQVTNSTITTYDKTQLVSYTKYAFSFLGITKNVTDATANRYLLSGDQQLFGIGGEIPKEVVFVSDGQGHVSSYTNYYSYDLWGNRIYSRQSINPTTNLSHESFSGYYNNGELPGFYAFQDSFSQSQGLASDNQWNVTNGYWMVSNGLYNGTETSGIMENTVSSTDVFKGDLSIQARVFVGKQTNFTAGVLARVGIFAHYIGGKYRWSLDLTNETTSGTFLELHDEFYQWLGVNGQPSAKTSCPLLKGSWYTFNMTIRGFTVTGSAKTQGQSPCNVSGFFSNASPAAAGTRFGLFAGGYSSLFDDVQVATVSPYLTGGGFSNSFVPAGPGPAGLNTWLATTKPPGPGWNLTVYPAASSWSQAYASQNYGATPWSTISGWPDTNAQWIWWDTNANVSASKDPVWFRRVFSLSSTTTLNVSITSDNSYVAYLDGTKLGTGDNWQQMKSYTISKGLGFHVLAINATNPDGPDAAGLLVSVKNVGTGQIVFRSDATAGQVISSLAGSADLQNGSPTRPVENYYGYTMWGPLNQTRTRYDPNALTIDSWANAGCSNTTTLCSVTLRTSHPNDIIIVFASETLNQGSALCTFSISDSSGMTWTARSSVVYARYDGFYGRNRDELQEFYAKSSSVLSSVTITESILSCGPNYNGLEVFAISGGNFSTPFDPNPNLPGTGHAETNGATINANATTNNAGELIFAGTQHGTGALPSFQSGFTGVISSANGVESTVTGGPLLNFMVKFGYSTSSYWEEIVDAVQPSTVAATQWLTTTRSYDNYGNLAKVVDARGNYTQYTYSSNGAYLKTQTRTVLPGSTQVVSSFGYNSTTGTLLWSQQPNGYNSNKYNTTFTYDVLGRTTKVTYPTGDYTTYSYSDSGNYANVTNENGWKTKQVYDGLGRSISTIRILNGGVYSNATSTYNWMNEVVDSTDALGNRVSNQYDGLGRLTSSTHPDGNVTTEVYNGQLSWVRYVDESNNSHCNSYDRLGRLVSVIENSDTSCLTGIVTNYYYDEIGDLIKITNANQASALYTYDDLGRQVQTSYADGTSETYTYDNSGNVVKKIDRNSMKSLFAYDSVDRLLTATYCITPTTPTTGAGYTYDKDGNALQVQNENATLTYGYDLRDRLMNETYNINPSSRTIVDLGCSGNGGTITRTGGSPKTYTVTQTYTGEALSTITYPTIIAQNIGVKYSYDGLGRVLNVTQSGSSTYYARSFTYDRDDHLIGLQFENGLIGNYTYDKLSRPQTITLKNSGTTVMSLTYGYNKTSTVGRIAGTVNGVAENDSYRYDALQRLTNYTVTSHNAITTGWYQYDNLGNRLSQKLNSTVTTYIYNSMNELTNSTAYSSPQVSTVYSYDLNGNLKTKNVTISGTTAKWAYTWDGTNRLLKVTSNGATQGTYAYDGAGRKVESIECSCWDIWFYAYNGPDTLWQTDANWGSIDFISANTLKLATIDSSGCSFCISSAKYYHLDALGSTRLVTDSSRAVTFNDGYQPYGQDNGTPFCSSTCETYKFTGKPVSQTTGLYYEYQRWYDPSVGRFISQDPNPGHLSDPQSFNLYAYVQNAPTTYTDPSGAHLMVSMRFPCTFDWWGYLPCNSQQSGVVATITTTASSSPEGAAIVITGLGIYVGAEVAWNAISNYFKGPHTDAGVVDPNGNDVTVAAKHPDTTISSTNPSIVIPTINQPNGIATEDTSLAFTNFKWLPEPYSSVKGLRGAAGWVCLGGATLAYAFWSFYAAPQSAVSSGLEYNLTPDQAVVSGDVLLMAVLGCAFLHSHVN